MDVDQFFQKSHYSINRNLLSISGLWPFDTKIKRYLIYITMLLVFGSGFIFQVYLRKTFFILKYHIYVILLSIKYFIIVRCVRKRGNLILFSIIKFVCLATFILYVYEVNIPFKYV